MFRPVDSTFGEDDGWSAAAVAAFEGLPYGAAVLTGPGDQVEAANAAFRRFAGREDLVGLRARDIVPPDVRDQVMDVVSEVRRSSGTVSGDRLPAVADASASGGRSVVLTATPVFHGGALRQIRLILDPVADDPDDDPALGDGHDVGHDLDDPQVVMVAQEALLPKGVAVLGSADLAAACIVGSDPDRHGGDWFDTVALGDDRVALVVGDVPGRGIAAVAVMSQLRSVLVAALRRTGDAQQALQELDAFAEHLPEAHATTLVVVTIDAGASELGYCTAGHPPPLVVPRAGDPRYLPPSGSGPLRSGASTFEPATHAWAPGDAVLLFSGGFLDRPGGARSSGTVELAAAAAECRAAAGGPLVDRLVRQLPVALAGQAAGDDLVLLAAQVPEERVGTLSLDLPATADSLLVLRRELERWLASLRLSAIDAMSLHHAVGELLANAVQHAYADADRGQVAVRVEITPDAAIAVEVTDEGGWLAREDQLLDATRGRGLNLARLLTDQLLLRTGPEGTSVRLRFTPQRPVSLYSAPAPAVRRPRRRLRAQVLDGMLGLAGSLDQGSADDLRQLLGRATRGSSRDAVVDLSAVELLDSTAVQVVLDAQQACAGNGRTLSLVAAPGSPAQQALDLARIPYRNPSGSGLPAL